MAKKRALIKKVKPKKQTLKLRTNHLLVIGIDEYEDKAIANLNNAVRDAQRFVEILQTEYQFEPAHTIELYNEAATKDKILEVFDHSIKNLGKQDNLIVYFSGHGDLVEHINRGYWIPTEARLEKRGDYLSNTDVLDFFRALNVHHIFAIVDACFSGALARNFEKIDANQRVDLKPSRWLLSSGALEKVADGVGKHSPFADSLFSALMDTDSLEINVLELCTSVLSTIDANTRDQTPIGQPLFGVGHMMGQFVFYKKGYIPKTVSVARPSSLENSKGPIFSSPTGAPEKKITDPEELVLLASGEEEGGLESVSITTVEGLKSHLKDLLAADLANSLYTFKKVLSKDSELINDIIIQLGTYNGADKQFAGGLSSGDQYNRTHAKIRFAMTQMIDELTAEQIRPDFADFLSTTK